MGAMVATSVSDSAGLVLAGGVETPGHRDVGRRLRDVRGEWESNGLVRSSLDDFDLSSFDVIVDFSTPAQALACAKRASAARKGLVIGTTGLNERELSLVKRAAADSPVVMSPNMSVGVNLLFSLTDRATTALDEGFDVEIVETHHKGKKDAPSGTALKLGEIVARSRSLDPATARICGRSGPQSARAEGEIGIHSLRSGGVAGRHVVHFISPLEEVVLSHEALSREAFARGAVQAVRFVHGRPPGLYGMADVLGLGP